MSKLDEIYKQKYLKYKAKYMELKRYEQEGGLLDSGFAIVYTSKDNAAKLKNEMNNGKISNKGDIANLLDRQAYIIFDGKKPAELLESTSRIMKDKLSAAVSATYSAASTAANATYKATTYAASAAASVANSTYNAATDKYKQYDEQKQKEAAATALVKANTPVDQVQKQQAAASPALAKLFGGADLATPLPLTLPTLDNKSFDRANEAHKKFMAASVATAFGRDASNVEGVCL